MNKIQALITLGLITEQDVWNYAVDMHYRAGEEQVRREEEMYTQADFEMDMAHNEVLPF